MDEFNMYPDKPELVERQHKSSWSLTVFSLVLFVLVFLLLFQDEVIFLAYLLTVLFIHEMGHFIAMKVFKYENVRMLFIPLMGAFVQGKKRNYSQKESLIVLIAGPFPGIAIGGFLIYMTTWGVDYKWLDQPAILFLLLNIINLLPLDPLDGGQMFKLFAQRKNEFFLMIFALISSLVVIGVGAYLWKVGIGGSLIVMIFGFLMAFRVRALQRKYQMHKDLMDENVNYAITYKNLSNRDFLKIKEVLMESTPALKRFVNQVSPDEADPIIASQVNNVLVVPLERDMSLFFRVAIVSTWILAFLTPFILLFAFGLNYDAGY